MPKRIRVCWTSRAKRRNTLRTHSSQDRDNHVGVVISVEGRRYRVNTPDIGVDDEGSQGEGSLITTNCERVLRSSRRQGWRIPQTRISKKLSGGHIGINEASDDSGDEILDPFPEGFLKSPTPSDSFEDADAAGSSREGYRAANTQSATPSRQKWRSWFRYLSQVKTC